MSNGGWRGRPRSHNGSSQANHGDQISSWRSMDGTVTLSSAGGVPPVINVTGAYRGISMSNNGNADVNLTVSPAPVPKILESATSYLVFTLLPNYNMPITWMVTDVVGRSTAVARRATGAIVRTCSSSTTAHSTAPIWVTLP